jgi:Domain of unknown function (DUF4232)
MTTAPYAFRRLAGGAALLGAVALVTACGGSSGPAGAPARTVTISPGPAGASGTASTPPAPAASASPGGTRSGAAPCPTRSLQAKAGVAQGAAGSTYQVIDFTNIGPVTCSLYGYPGVSLAGGTPVRQIGLAAVEGKATPRTLVTLAPGAVANALLQIVQAQNYPPANCQPVAATYLQIYPPNQTTPIYLGYRSTACSKPVQILTVSVVQAGSGGSS